MATKELKEITVTIRQKEDGIQTQVAGRFYCPEVSARGSDSLTLEGTECDALFALAKEKLKAQMAEGGHEVTE